MSASDAPEHPAELGAPQLPEPLGGDSSCVHSAAGEPIHPVCAADYDSSDEEGGSSKAGAKSKGKGKGGGAKKKQKR